MIEMAIRLREDANKMCFIAASVSFPIHHNPIVTTAHGIP
jgi:hypothetical protein